MDATTILYILGGIVVVYFIVLILSGIFKGWSGVKNILFYTVKVGWIFLIIGGAIIVFISLGRKKKDAADIKEKLDRLNALEAKTEADKREIERLEKEAAKIQQGITDTSTNFGKKIEELKRKPNEPKPGDAAQSADAMNNVWK